MTIKQKNLAKLAIENPLTPKGKLVAMGGYSVAMQKQPGKVLESKGFLEALDSFGLTEELLTTSLVADIKAKPKNRKPELELGYKVRGLLNPDIPPTIPRVTNFTQIIINAPTGN